MECYEDVVILQGAIISKRVNEEKKMGAIVVNTTSSSDRTKHNCPRLVSFDLRQIADFEVGDFVCIKAEVQSYLGAPAEEGGRRPRRQSLVIKEITKAKTRVEQEYGVESTGLFLKKNEAKLAGNVQRITPRDGGLWYITLRVVTNGRMNTLLVKVYENDRNRNLLQALLPGQNVCLVGMVQTKFKQRENSQRTYFQDIIALDISTVA